MWHVAARLRPNGLLSDPVQYADWPEPESEVSLGELVYAQLPWTFELSLVSEDFPDHQAQPRVHLSAPYVCLFWAVGTDTCYLICCCPELASKSWQLRLLFSFSPLI